MISTSRSTLLLALILTGCPQTAGKKTAAPEATTKGRPLRIPVIDDAKLRARIVHCKHLRFAQVPPKSDDVPPFVRAGSGLCATSRGLYVVQDDVLALARLASPEKPKEAEVLLLPKGKDGRRVYDVAAGNRRQKPDFETCVTLRFGSEEIVAAFPSGSKSFRSQVALAQVSGSVAPRLFDGGALYRALDAERRFSGPRLNVEGVANIGSSLRFYQRANTGKRRGEEPLSASAELDRKKVEAWLQGRGPLPAIEALRHYDLGRTGTTRWGFTDALGLPDGRALILAAAESTNDAGHDGPTVGSRLGVDDGRTLRWTLLKDPDGKPTRRKVEGLARDPQNPARYWIATDSDNHLRPAELCAVHIQGL